MACDWLRCLLGDEIIENNTMNYGIEIKRLRKAEGLTREQLSELSGVPDRNLGMIEIGQRSCSEQLFCVILKALGYRLEKRIEKIENSSVKT